MDGWAVVPNGVATALPMSLELATVLKAVSVRGGCDSSGKCSTFSSVSLSFEGVSVSSGPEASPALSGVSFEVSSAVIGGVCTASSAIGGIGSSSACTAGSWATSCAGVSSGSCLCSSGAGTVFSAGLGTAGAGFGGAENMLAHVFFAALWTADAAASTVDLCSGASFVCSAAWPFSLGSAVAAGVVSHAADSVVGIEEAARGAPLVLGVPPRPPRVPVKPPRPRSVPRPRPPRTLSPPRRAASPRPPRVLDAPSEGSTFSFALERERSAFLGTSANCETEPRRCC
jgi:hypothetical protein